MTTYELQNAGRLIDGYFSRRPNETKENAFERAKQEASKNLRQSALNIETLTIDQFHTVGFQTQDGCKTPEEVAEYMRQEPETFGL